MLINGRMSIDDNCRPMMRWWLPAADVSFDEIEKELKSASTAGFRGLELCINMGGEQRSLAGLEEYGWGSRRWNELYKFILKTANAIGMQIDTTISPAWPAAVPGLSPEDSGTAKELIICESGKFTGNINGALPRPAGNPGCRLVAVTAARVIGASAVTKAYGLQWGDMPGGMSVETRPTCVLEEDSLITLPASCVSGTNDGYHVSWTAPGKRDWIVFACYMRATGQESKQGKPCSRRCMVIDHFGKHGASAITDFWNKTLLDDESRSLLRENGGAIFEDSLELAVSDGTILWTEELCGDFYARRGYDLTPCIPLLRGISAHGFSSEDFYDYEVLDEEGLPSDKARQIRRDFLQTMTELYCENHVNPIQSWAASLSLGYRAQCYSSIIDTAQVSACVDRPEGESLGFGPGIAGYDRFRLVSGAAHVAKRRTISDEVGAIGGKGYRLTWLQMLSWINRNFSGGANMMIFHGYPYLETAQSTWPGFSPFGFGLGEYWGERQPSWPHVRDLTDYLARVQTLLHRGSPRVDLLILTELYGMYSPIFEDQQLTRCGFCYDIVTAPLLPALRVGKDGILCPDGPGYKAMIVDSRKKHPRHVLQELEALAHSGATVLYYTGHEDLCKALSDSGIRPCAELSEQSAELMTVHRRDDSGDFYHIHNAGEQRVDAVITLEGDGWVHEIDLWSGHVFRLCESESLTLSFFPGEARAFTVSRSHTGTPPPSVSENAMQLRNWSFEIQRWENASLPKNPACTKKTVLSLGVIGLDYWDRIPALPRQTCGLGCYRRSFFWHGESKALIEIENAHFCSIRIFVNGRQAPFNPYRRQALTDNLHSGENTIEIHLASTLVNQLIFDGSIRVPEWMPEAVPQPEHFGICGAVKLRQIAESPAKRDTFQRKYSPYFHEVPEV